MILTIMKPVLAQKAMFFHNPVIDWLVNHC